MLDLPDVVVTEPRATTEARIAMLRAQLTIQATKLFSQHIAKALVPVILQAIAAALRAVLWVGQSARPLRAPSSI